jgi:DNA-directed RNA polymerase subunit M/transcription elongation factor TFIIS
MRFCPNCDNIIIPKGGKLYCQACEEEYALPDKDQTEFKIVKRIKHDDSADSPIVLKGDTFKSSKISNQDRKAFEEFFRGDGATNSY